MTQRIYKKFNLLERDEIGLSFDVEGFITNDIFVVQEFYVFMFNDSKWEELQDKSIKRYYFNKYGASLLNEQLNFLKIDRTFTVVS